METWHRPAEPRRSPLQNPVHTKGPMLEAHALKRPPRGACAPSPSPSQAAAWPARGCAREAGLRRQPASQSAAPGLGRTHSDATSDRRRQARGTATIPLPFPPEALAAKGRQHGGRARGLQKLSKNSRAPAAIPGHLPSWSAVKEGRARGERLS